MVMVVFFSAKETPKSNGSRALFSFVLRILAYYPTLESYAAKHDFPPHSLGKTAVYSFRRYLPNMAKVTVSDSSASWFWALKLTVSLLQTPMSLTN